MTYRVGNHQPRNLYRGDAYIGVCFDPADTALIVDAMESRRAVIDSAIRSVGLCPKRAEHHLMTSCGSCCYTQLADGDAPQSLRLRPARDLTPEELDEFRAAYLRAVRADPRPRLVDITTVDPVHGEGIRTYVADAPPARTISSRSAQECSGVPGSGSDGSEAAQTISVGVECKLVRPAGPGPTEPCACRPSQPCAMAVAHGAPPAELNRRADEHGEECR